MNLLSYDIHRRQKLEESFSDGDCIARKDRLSDRNGSRYGFTVNNACQIHPIALGARPEAARHGQRVLNRHPVYVGILSRIGHFTKNKEGAIRFHLNGDSRFTQIAASQTLFNSPFQIRSRKTIGVDQANQRHRDAAGAINSISVGQRVLTEHYDAQAVA